MINNHYFYTVLFRLDYKQHIQTVDTDYCQMIYLKGSSVGSLMIPDFLNYVKPLLLILLSSEFSFLRLHPHSVINCWYDFNIGDTINNKDQNNVHLFSEAHI